LIQNTSTVTSRELLNRQFEGELKFRCPKSSVQKHTQPFGSKHVERGFAGVQMESAQQAGDAVEVIAVKMSDKYRMNSAPLHAGSHQLQLRSLAAVEKEHIAFADQRR